MYSIRNIFAFYLNFDKKIEAQTVPYILVNIGTGNGLWLIQYEAIPWINGITKPQ